MIKTLYVIHHSHTDIGYTQSQSRIARWHVAFIRQAMRIAARRDDFVWTCETLHGVEQFWNSATPVEREAFAALVHAGRIGLTGAYFHFNELPDEPLLTALANRVGAFASLGMPIHAAMHADINGCALTHARAMANAGIRFLLTCVHPHHGNVPFGRRQMLFRWDLDDGHALTVCHCDHYNTGNELGLAPGAEMNYSAGFTDAPTAFDDDVLERRLPAYLQHAQACGWEHDFLAVGVSGLVTDNAPPSQLIAERIERWNKKHAASGPRIEMITPDRLAEVVASRAAKLPTHRGDWPDWWSDGVAGDPEAVALFRHAQRERRWLGNIAKTEDLVPLDESLALFAEHTFGHSASVSAPWNLLAGQLRLRKLSYAAEAADLAQALIDRATDQLGGGALAVDQPMTFRVLNPLDAPSRDLVELETESGEARRWNLENEVRIVRKDSREVIPHQIAHSHRGRKVLVDLSLEPAAHVDLSIEPAETPPTPINLHPILPDGARDVRENSADIPPTGLTTDHVDIAWTIGEGITRWRSVADGRSLIDPVAGALPFVLKASRLHAPMTGRAQCDIRRHLGRNRNSSEARWSASRLLRARAAQGGAHTEGVILDYAIDGCELLQVKLDARRHQPRVDVEVIMHKVGTWDVENLYLALPFTSGDGAQFWVDRAYPMRPGIDQLPGTLMDYIGAQDGLGWCGSDYGVAITQLDSHLVQMGPLDYAVRPLSGDRPQSGRPACVHSWLMTNYWETNFAPEVGGFYSFRYVIQWGPDLRDVSKAFAISRAAATPLRAFRLAAADDAK